MLYKKFFSVLCTVLIISLNFSLSVSAKEIGDNLQYYLKNCYSGKYMQVEEDKMYSGIVQSDFSGNENQIFKFIRSGTGYEIEPVSALGMRLDIKNASSKNGTALQLYKINKQYSKAQTFKIIENKDGTYRIISNISSSEKAIEAAGPSKQNKAKVQIWDYKGLENQKWELISINEN